MTNDTSITVDQLIEAGTALYGDTWQSNLARALDIDPRRVRQWLKEERPIPPWLTNELVKLLIESSETTQALAVRLQT